MWIISQIVANYNSKYWNFDALIEKGVYPISSEPAIIGQDEIERLDNSLMADTCRVTDYTIFSDAKCTEVVDRDYGYK